ncbi:hypothetical protein BSKO_07850 [Bryopsis sp. KO-2023]|nr:hypothetical protein BSKO_07850 [Bryopsis sp. KO-2023]
MSTTILAGIGVGAAALAARSALQAFNAFKAAPQKFYKGGFLPEMTRREAALILGLRESTPEEKIKEAHRRIMIANHPDAGGSDYMASKINEAKDMLIVKKRGKSSVF